MLLVVALLGFFCLIGLAARRFSMGVRWLLLAGIAVMVMLNFIMRGMP